MLRPKLTKQCLHDLLGAIMENALFCTRSLRQSGRLWWKMGEQYSSTDLIPVQWKSTNIFTAHAEPKKKIHRGYYMGRAKIRSFSSSVEKYFKGEPSERVKCFFNTRSEISYLQEAM